MVDALKESRRVLSHSGTLVDYRPTVDFPPIELLQSGTAVKAGSVDDSNASSDSAAADAAIQKLVEAGAFAMNRTSRFEIAYYWDSFEEMSEYLRSRRHRMGVLPSEREVQDFLQRTAGATIMRLRCRWHFQLTTYVR